VAKTISTLFRKAPETVGNPDEAIALGAAIYAGFKADPSRLSRMQQESIRGMRFQEVAPHFFGTLARSRNSGQTENSIIIDKNTPIPCERSEDFYTVADDQTEVMCTITQSPQPETDPRFVKIVWKGEMAIPGGRPRGQRITITYAYQENGTMSASFVDTASGQRTIVDIAAQSSGTSSGIDINDFLVE
jgi:molecular chaperone DnaK (HSP70)